MKGKKVPLIFLTLLTYIVLQSIWWMYSIYNLSQQVVPSEEIQRKKWMIFGEGSVFLVILIFAFIIILRNIRKELQLSKQQKNFLMSITHELKTPIASIKLYLQTLIKRELDKQKQHEIIEKSIKDTDRLNSLLETILLATKIEDKNHILNKEQLNISLLTKETCLNLLETSPKQIDIEFFIEDNLYLSADKDSIVSILNNLIGNAIKYSPAKSNITVKLTKSSQSLLLSIADQGPGISSIEKEKIFNKFYRIGDENTRKEQGTGLGLFIVKYLVEQHNGQVLVQKNSPKGAIFTCEFMQ